MRGLRRAGLLLWLWSLPAMAPGWSVNHQFGLKWLFCSMRKRRALNQSDIEHQQSCAFLPLPPSQCTPHDLKAKELRRRSPGPQPGQSSTTATVVLLIELMQGAPPVQDAWMHLLSGWAWQWSMR